MLTVDDYGAIRRARRDGKSIRQIARDFNHSRNMICLILQHPDPNPSPRNYAAPVLGPFQALIDQILVDDEDAPPKQRHTALWGTCQANASRPILATFTSISPMAGGRFPSWSRPGPTRTLPSFWLSPLASPDRDRAGDPCRQRDRDADQERGVPGPEGFRHLRLHGPATPFQAQDHGVSTMRID